MTKHRQMLLTAIVAAWVFLPTGCSLILFGLGSIRDATTPEAYEFTPFGLDSIKRGTYVEVLKTDSSIISGDFERVESTQSDAYTTRYRRFVNSLPMGETMPELGDTILIVKHGASGRGELTGELLGFDTKVIRVHLAGWKGSAGVLLEAVDTVRNSKAEVVDGDLLRQYVRRNQVPNMSAVVLSNEQGTKIVYLDEVIQVREPSSKNAKWWALLGGSVLDAIIIISAANDKPTCRAGVGGEGGVLR